LGKGCGIRCGAIGTTWRKHGNLRNTLTELLKNWWEHQNPKASPTHKRRKWALMGAS
jgi:hypothetical protein